MANSGGVEIHSSVTDSLRSVHGVVYMIFYGRIRIPRSSGNFGACTDSVYQALLSPHEREPGFEARSPFALRGYFVQITVLWGHAGCLLSGVERCRFSEVPNVLFL